MNESFLIRLQKGNKQLPISSVSSDGIRFTEEISQDATPYRFLFQLSGANEVTRYRLRRISELNNWSPNKIVLKPFIQDGCIGFKGIAKNSLPFGYYSLRMQLEDYELLDKFQKFRLEEDKQATVKVGVKADARSVKIKDVSVFDGDTKRILFNNEKSEIDGLKIQRWLDETSRRPKRKACLLNIMALLHTVPSEDDPLITDVEHIFFADVDRIYAGVTSNFFKRLQNLAKDKDSPFYREGKPKAEIHQKLLEKIKGPGKFDLDSYRGEGRPSLQTVVAIPKAGSQFFAEIDIDLGNILQDLAGFVIHIGELINPGKTDHLTLREKIKSHAAKYLYYEVV